MAPLLKLSRSSSTFAEDHAVLRHLRDDLQRLIHGNGAVDDLRARGLAHERLADAEDQAVVFPGNREAILDGADLW